jgi:hypothetical protein
LAGEQLRTFQVLQPPSLLHVPCGQYAARGLSYHRAKAGVVSTVSKMASAATTNAAATKHSLLLIGHPLFDRLAASAAR